MTIEKMKAYHSEWPSEDLMKARGDGIVTDGGEAWRYEFTHTDDLGKYDAWWRNTDPLNNEPEFNGGLLRDYFAGQALAGMIATSPAPALYGFEDSGERTAQAAYKIADAMLEARAS